VWGDIFIGLAWPSAAKRNSASDNPRATTLAARTS
jgi:hypothetical protein